MTEHLLVAEGPMLNPWQFQVKAFKWKAVGKALS